MRFKEFVAEQKQGMSYEEVVKAIATHCKPYLSDVPDIPLYRGVPRRYLVAGLNPHPENRTPRDSAPSFNFPFNCGFQLAFSEPSIRTHSVFATGNAAMTGEYGEAAFMFPVGEYKFAWSPYYNDSYEHDANFMAQIVEAFYEECDENERKKFNRNSRVMAVRLSELFDQLSKRIMGHQWVKNVNDHGEDTTLSVISELDTEMFNSIRNVYAKLVNALQKVISKLYVDNEDLHKAVLSGNEILFYRTNGYYLVPYDIVTEEMDKQNLGIKNRLDRFRFLMNDINNV